MERRTDRAPEDLGWYNAQRPTPPLRRDIHLRTPAAEAGYKKDNPLRIESAAEAAAIDGRIAELWHRRPLRLTVEASPDFLDKAARALDVLRDQMPECCRHHVIPLLADHHHVADHWKTARSLRSAKWTI
jgi:hypothetical protein